MLVADLQVREDQIGASDLGGDGPGHHEQHVMLAVPPQRGRPRLGDSSGCTAAISKPRTQAEGIKHDDGLPYLYWVGSAEVTAGAERSLLKRGKLIRRSAC